MRIDPRIPRLPWFHVASRFFLTALLAVNMDARGTVLIEQPAFDSEYQILEFAPLGQSFVAVDGMLGVVDVRLTNMNVQGHLNDRHLTFKLLAGNGLGGAALFTTTVDVSAQLGDLQGQSDWVRFGVGSAVPLQVGASYTFELVPATPRFGLMLSQVGTYAGGRAFFTDRFSGAQFGDGMDLAFRVSSVPEVPASLLLAAGLMVGGIRKRVARAARSTLRK